MTGVAVTPVRWLLGGEWRAHPARLAVAILAIAVGVALGFAVHLVNGAALAQFGRAVQSINGSADLQIRSVTPAGFDEALYPRLARIAGVAAVSPAVELSASSGTATVTRLRSSNIGSGRITVLGLDPLRAALVTPSLIGVPVAAGPGAGEAFASDAVFVSRAALRSFGNRLGDTVTLNAAGHRQAYRIAGILAGAGDDEAIAVIDIAEAQWRFGQLGRLQRIDVRLADGIDRDTVMARLAAALPVDAVLGSPETTAARTDSLSRAYRVNLEMLAMVALLTGGFLVYSAQSLAVTRRQPQFALLRVLGMSRTALTAQLVIEGALLGLAGAALGIAGGYGLAVLAIRLLGGDLGGGYFGSGAIILGFPLSAALGFAAIGIIVAIAASVFPALAAARIAPAVALKSSGDSSDPRDRPRASIGLLLLGFGGLAALGPPVAGLPLLGYAAMALLLAGGVAVMPWLARSLLAPLQGLDNRWPAIDLALKRLWGAPGQAAVALCGIVASTALMVAMAVMVSSFRASVDAWLVQILPSDIYLHIEAAEAGGLDRRQQARLAKTPGVATITFVRQLPLRLAVDKPSVVLSGQAIDVARPGDRLAIIGPVAPVPAGQTPVWISEPMGWLYGLRPGDRLTLPLGGAARPVFVAGVWRDYARQFGAIAMRDQDLARLTGDATMTEAAVDILPGENPRKVIARLRQRLPPELAGQALFGQPRQLRTMALSIFDRSFIITYALEAIAVAIGLVGVAATFSAQTLARRREFGMLRHIGVRRGQIAVMLATEGALLGLIGVIAGATLGLVMSQVLIHVINPQSFHWTMDTRLPWGLFAALPVAMVAAAAGTAMLAGRQALSVAAIQAVRDDW